MCRVLSRRRTVLRVFTKKNSPLLPLLNRMQRKLYFYDTPPGKSCIYQKRRHKRCQAARFTDSSGSCGGK
ncbi:hypothetical protein DRA42_11245 [Ethanoligenens harbinense]|nr:hypothetical protein CXP51_11105 [Ethanoligenens harbinense]AYF42216.1 hypothetical protein CN246_11650 [Ethanoligenens harbinense]QCN92972.1 hypothetical protein DRA42_11245 [Ethanoligenens harbinense]